MPRPSFIRPLLLGTLLAFELHGQTLGDPPPLGASSRDLAASFHLPPLPQPAGEVRAQLDRLQVGRRAKELGIDGSSALRAWHAADSTLRSARARLLEPGPANVRRFTGTRASQLNAVLRDPAVTAVRVEAPALTMDVPVLLARPDLRLELGATRLEAVPGGPRFLLRIENAARATVTGGRFTGGTWAVLVRGGADVTLDGGRYDSLTHGGVAIGDSPRLVLANAHLTGMGGPAVLVHGATTGAAIVHNDIVANHGGSNWHAGIVVSDRIPADRADPTTIFTADHRGVTSHPIHERLEVPRGNLVAYNRIAHNKSSGIYADGAIGNVFFDNVIEGNSKEGVCLDNGSTANVLAMNLVRENGKRWGKSDDDLRREFVLQGGRLPDGTPVIKVPGISLDNAAYNVVYANQVDRNHGGGIKMVRTAFLNTVGLNVVTDNAEGRSRGIYFFGIELGAAIADEPVKDLDFAPSRGNVVFGNMIRGPHHAGIYFGAGSTDNEVLDNVIREAAEFAFEQARPQANRFVDNHTDLPSNNLRATATPRMVKLFVLVVIAAVGGLSLLPLLRRRRALASGLTAVASR